MPHSLYLGSGIVQPRLLEYDKTHASLPAAHHPAPRTPSSTTTPARTPTTSPTAKHQPSLAAIRACLSFSIVELSLSLFTFALFVNSAILIVAGASLSGSAASATLFDIHTLLSHTIGPAAGILFALALLLSGTSAGIVCTIAGQMVSEGQLRWSIAPWQRRLITRSISITPSIIIAGAVGQRGLSAALEASQVALSVILPFTSAPLIYFTCREKFMLVDDDAAGDADGDSAASRTVSFRNNWVTATFAVLFWLLICIMNVAALVLTGKGEM